MALKSGNDSSSGKKPVTNKVADSFNDLNSGIAEPEDRGELKLLSLRLYEQDIEDLKKIFKRKGMGVSTGIRMVLRDFIEDSKRKM